jgi:DNA repair protein RadC
MSKQIDSKQINYKHHIDKTWCVEDQPANKLVNMGANSLTDTELVAILLNGTPNASEVARTLYHKAENNLSTLSHFSVEQLVNVEGIGSKKAAVINAAFELGRRNVNNSKPHDQIKSSQSVNDLMAPLIADIQHEEFWLLCLNRTNKVIGRYKISQGGLSGTVIDTRIILKKSIDVLASSIIVCHNHPSGNKQPSEADIKITDKLKKAAETLEIKLLDHVIVTTEGHFSFADEGLLT